MNRSDVPTSTSVRQRVLSGMRPTGELHLGHYHGALKNWVRLQADYDCFYFVADWHALTTHYEDREVIEKNVYDMVIDWLAAGLDPERATKAGVRMRMKPASATMCGRCWSMTPASSRSNASRDPNVR